VQEEPGLPRGKKGSEAESSDDEDLAPAQVCTSNTQQLQTCENVSRAYLLAYHGSSQQQLYTAVFLCAVRRGMLHWGLSSGCSVLQCLHCLMTGGTLSY